MKKIFTFVLAAVIALTFSAVSFAAEEKAAAPADKAAAGDTMKAEKKAPKKAKKAKKAEKKEEKKDAAAPAPAPAPAK